MQDDDVAVGDSSSLAGQVAVVTGAGQGIGRALVDQFVHEQVRAVVAFDRDADALAALGDATNGSGTTVVPYVGDVRERTELERMVRWAEGDLGRIDIFCSNAGVMTGGGVDAPDSAWQRSWEINVMAHVHAARAVLPGMLSRSAGAFVNILSAAGLLSAPESAPYTVTKHAALGFAEWLAINFGDQGITVCAVCPEAVDTQMLRDSLAQSNGSIQRISAASGVMSPDQVAVSAIESLKERKFLLTTHPRTLRNVQKKWADVDTWIRAMGSLISEGKD
jgi:NAD(P)-dependent dehydrogenase (short-subunit alcohol dehydrogenase family)